MSTKILGAGKSTGSSFIIGHMWLERMVEWARARQRVIAYTAGILLVCLWTLLRFFTKRTIFDLVSQQVIVQQWLHGQVSVAHMGQTAYIPKMLLLYAPMEILPGSPRLKLTLLTLAINIATFVFIGLIAERILREFHVRIGWVFYASLVWLGAVAGSVFWIEFANSRNLEVAGGLLLLYLGIRFIRRPNAHLEWGVATLGSLLFFSDPLQVYMTAIPLVLYAGTLAVAKRCRKHTVAVLCGLLLFGFVVSKVLFALTGHWLHLSFTDTGNAAAPHLSTAWLAQSASGTVKSAVSLLAGANDAGRAREAANVGLLLLGVVGVFYGAVRRQISRRLLLLVGCVWIVDTLVYMASGQAVHGAATSRYLIMTVPALLLAFGSVRLPKIAIRPAMVTASVVVALNLTALAIALTAHWSTSFPADAHIASAYRYILNHPNTRVYASTDTAMPAQYLYRLPAERALPVGCLNGALVQTHFSMDGAFAHNATEPNTSAAIVLDESAITNTPNVCSVASIEARLGQPQSVDYTDDGSAVMYYPQSAMHPLR